VILRFLRLFSAFRALEQDRGVIVDGLRESVQELTTEKLLLRDRLDAVMNDRGELWRMMERAIENERDTLKTQANFYSQQRYGVVQYPESVKLPESMEASEHAAGPLGRRQMPSERMAQQTSKFIREYQDRHKVPTAGPVSA
jgi:hypothetical protein